ncbi:polysaccharide deacetylase family protein [Streptomyces brasiliscabiei]|uniref:Polysaccharide deacetylase family protein n=2 Tax=Streptomyces TaxID=1883 RepID=A0ABU8G4R3_9ACTN|nr:MULTISPECIES: polysaccharide deacetylase family protein [Streptomyces]MBZ3904605.1 polysaccharide deacetylase family protein [Streptomyces griseiscabiei]MDX2908354.1 polysaccharide deacetylase family protein [Streptomyces griseiscabiei]
MIRPVRRITALAALCALGAALSACGGTRPSTRIVNASASPTAVTSSRPPTLAPGPAGLTPVFEHGLRSRGDKTVALTFDADMTVEQGERAAEGERFDNPELIAALRQLKVPATVFLTGRWVEEYPIQARSIGRDPLFEVANHSYSHHAFTADCHGLPTMAPGRMRADLERAYRVFHEAGVRDPMPYFRFPGGCYDSRALRNLSASGVTAVQWDVVSGDAFATDAEDVVREVLDGVRPGSVVVMHCTRSGAPVTEKAVRKIVPVLRARGYRFVKVSDLVGATTATAP